MTPDDRQAVLDMLVDNIHDDYGEARPDRSLLPAQAVDNATTPSLRAFVEIHQGISRLLHSSHTRTRYIGVATSAGGYGVSYYRKPVLSKVANRSNREIKAVCLPTKPRWQGLVEVYFSGHDEVPVESTDVQIVGERAGHPVYRVRNAPEARFVRQTIAALESSALFDPTLSR